MNYQALTVLIANIVSVNGPKSTRQILDLLRMGGSYVTKADVKEAIWRLLDSEEVEITRDYKLKSTR